DLGDEFGARDGGGVDADLVGTRAQQPVDIVDGAHPATDGERDEHLFSRATDDVEHRRAVATGGGDVEERQLVDTLLVVDGRHLDGVARIAQIDEVDALDHAARVDVQAGDDTDGETHSHEGSPWVRR